MHVKFFTSYSCNFDVLICFIIQFDRIIVLFNPGMISDATIEGCGDRDLAFFHFCACTVSKHFSKLFSTHFNLLSCASSLEVFVSWLVFAAFDH